MDPNLEWIKSSNYIAVANVGITHKIQSHNSVKLAVISNNELTTKVCEQQCKMITNMKRQQSILSFFVAKNQQKVTNGLDGGTNNNKTSSEHDQNPHRCKQVLWVHLDSGPR